MEGFNKKINFHYNTRGEFVGYLYHFIMSKCQNRSTEDYDFHKYRLFITESFAPFDSC